MKIWSILLAAPLLLFNLAAINQVEQQPGIAPAESSSVALPPPVVTAATGVWAAADVEAFMDSFWLHEMQPLNIPGAIFILVNNGEIQFSKGYGLADVSQNKPVVPGETLFAIGSVSKAVTATAVMQLVERGQLRMDHPVNNYLKSTKIGDSCAPPVTAAHLLTHSAGFDEQVIGAFVTTVDQITPLSDYVARDLPPCIRSPGQEISYCNHCYGLAGLLVQEVAGQPFEQYVEENILQPLEMHSSSFRQPLPPKLEAKRATGYIFSPQIQPAPQVYANFFPSGGLWASGDDMGKFMIGHLQGGLAGKQKILNEETLAEMHRRQFSQGPLLEGWTYGFSERLENGQRLIEKGGDVPGFSSALYLLPEHDLGFFLSYNATVPFQAGMVDPREIFPGRFLDHYFPARENPRPAHPTGAAARLSGNYRLARFSHTTIDKIISPMSMLQWHVQSEPDGSISLAYPALLGGQKSRWAEVEPGLFQNPETSSYLTFAQDERSRVTHIYTKISEEAVLERAAWYESLTFQAFLLVFLVATFLLSLVVTIFSISQRPKPAGRLRLAPWLSGALALLNLIFLTGLALTVLQSVATRAPQLPEYMVGFLFIPLLTALLSIILLVFTLLAWKDHYGSLLSRLYYSLVTLAGLGFIWFASYWNLLGFKL